MNPDAVGPLVLEAIQEQKFWVFTHPEMLEFVQTQLDLAKTDRSIRKF